MTGGFDFGPPAPRRRPSLTPMIDVVFLLLVFFMLAARFAIETSLPLAAAGGAASEWSGPPRVVTVAPDAVALNGVPVAEDALAEALAPLLAAPGDLVVLRPVEGADAGRIVAVAERLAASGLTLALVE